MNNMKFKLIKSKAEGDQNNPNILSSEEIDNGDLVDMRDKMYYEKLSAKKAGFEVVVPGEDKMILVSGSGRALWVYEIIPA